ncbi:MAG: nucleotidyltransferase family protein [Lachnospiraceae bacterium]|nr:nucleotidyltransferase family protein [Lachnospiraceae bacterium]
MIVCGIIAEFNPFHNGHAYLLEQARLLTRADYLIVVMSGDYVQRGEPACMDKYCRAKAAILAGADAVFELPVTVATGSAEYFARGAVAALDALGIVDYLCFGSESGNLQKLQELAEKDFRSKHSNIRQSFSNESLDTELPNNILAVEYLRALNYFHSPMKPITVQREGAGYHDTAAQEGTYCSATALRPLLHSLSDASLPATIHSKSSQGENKAELLHRLSRFVPDCTLPIISEYYNSHRYLEFRSVSDLLFYHFMMHPSEDLTDYFDIYGGLADKIQNALFQKRSADLLEFRNSLKTKDIAMTHISRALLHILLSIKNSDVEIIKKYEYCAYLRLLGFYKEASPLMNMIKTSSKCPIITKLADAKNKLQKDQLSLLEKDIAASNLYQQLSLINKETAEFIGEYRQPVIIAKRL